jgi:AmmeMemoRadiSam system protein A
MSRIGGAGSLLNVMQNFRKFSQDLPPSDFGTLLSDAEKRFLLGAARTSVASAVRKTPPPYFEPSEPSLLRRCGAFVTLREGNELRGCIGYIDPIKPLGITVCEVAAKAAIEDTRFPPVTPAELEGINIEISVISPLTKMNNMTEIEMGKHGLLIEYKRSRGLLLPQVPVEFGWDRDTFLAQTARKAGLPPLIWKNPDAETFIFTAEIFDEKSEIHERI